MVQRALEIADNPVYGYSQKPPSGRWGPDFDCGTLMYEVADYAGYDVGRGKDKVRFTGTLAEDFKRAGFQILPFANVGLGELEVGDILLNLALHAEIYVGEGQSVGALSSETGGFVGEAGDQTGQEISKHPVYEFDKGWDYVVRPPKEDEDTSEEDGEGESEMPSYPNYGGTWRGGSNTWTPNYTPNYNSNYGAYPQGNGTYGGNSNYPQGNLAQMNGYSQANSGYGNQPSNMPMGAQGGRQQLMQVRGIEEAKDVYVAPGNTVPMFDWNNYLMFLKSADQEGIPSLRVFKLEECSEDFPQHHHPGAGGMMQQPMGQQDQFVSRDEFEQLKEMIGNVQSVLSGDGGFQQGGDGSGSQQGNGKSQSNNGRNSRNS